MQARDLCSVRTVYARADWGLNTARGLRRTNAPCVVLRKPRVPTGSEWTKLLCRNGESPYNAAMRCGRVLLLWAVVCSLTACNEEGPPPKGVWYGEIGAMVRDKCAGCHRPGGAAPFSLYDYEDAIEHTGQMLDAIDQGIMPPFFANDAPDCVPQHPWRDDPRLTEAERASLHEWVAAGAPAGTPRELPDVPSTTLEQASVEVRPVQPFQSSGNRDQFVCFVFDPQITQARWLTGSQVYPTAVELVHHVNVYLIHPSQAEATIADMGGIGVPKLPCEHPPGRAIQSWLPGNPALVLPESVGIPIDPGTLVLIQVHYHPAGGGGTDETAVALRLTDEKPVWRYELRVYGNSPGPPHLLPGPGDPETGPIFMIPANVPDHVENMLIRHQDVIPEPRILSVTPHMHLLGTHERVTVTHADGNTECLIDSGWNFDWQRTYYYDADLEQLPMFEPGSYVNVSCQWDNTFANPNMPRLLYNTGLVAPYDVHLGLTTGDEMCLADFGVVLRN